MVKERRQRVGAWLRERWLDGAFFCSPASVRYLSGYTPPLEAGSSPFEGGPTLLLLQPDGSALLFVSELEEGIARAKGQDLEVLSYPCYDIYAERLDAPVKFTEALTAILQRLVVGKGQWGVEGKAFPVGAFWRLQENFPNLSWQDISGQWDVLRAVKDEDEIALLRRVCEIASCGQQAARTSSREGLTEIEVFSQVHAAMEAVAGERLPVVADFLSGSRTSEVGGPPSRRRLSLGDLILCDLVPCLDGYWGDSCDTFCIGEPTEEQKQWHRIVSDALRKGIDALRPGVTAQEIDCLVRGVIQKHGFNYPHHTGHGLGVTYHEEPRIYPVNPLPIQAGMVIALEPGIYVEGIGGVRLEDVVLVTSDGVEVLTHFREGWK